MSDEIHVIPTEGQSADEVAEVFTKAAAAQGLDADAINVEGDEVLVPQDIAATLRTNMKSFPPVNQTYQLTEAIMLSMPGATAHDGGMTGKLDGFSVIVDQSS